ncbi:MAG: hypothetical protein JO307_16980, partial [Bryobacterales bacterium]|nr:hypothetical protein [Bryobacterales bacterium]
MKLLSRIVATLTLCAGAPLFGAINLAAHTSWSGVAAKATPLGGAGGSADDAGPASPGQDIAVTDPTHNGGDTAVCTSSSHDDRPAIQTTLNYASNNGIPIVTMPGANCYMNSYADVGGVTGNLQIPNGVTLQGFAASTKILQTSLGRPTCTDLCTVTVINVGTFAVTWSKMGCPSAPGPCTGYYPLNPTTAGSKVVSLGNSFQGPLFHIGDYITIYEHQPQAQDDVLNGFQSIVINVSGGTITLADNLARSWPNPYLGNLSTGASQGIAHIGHDIGVKGIIVEGACPILMTESFQVTLQNDEFISDTDLYDSNHQYISVPQWNSLVHYTFASNQFISTGINGNWWAAEMTQRNSGFGLWTDNVLGVAGPAGFGSWGLSEFAYSITFTSNQVFTNPVSDQVCGFNLGAQNATISNNTFHTSGSWSTPGGGLI